MSKHLSGLLDQPEILVESAIKKLEHTSGWESTDVRLLAEVNNKVRAKLTELGLDPDDTTGPELYHALLVKLAGDEKNLNLNSEELTKKIQKAHSDYKVYALKHSVAKDLLRNHPPRKLMKQLNYRSIDSMLKRENVCELYAGLQQVESSRWLNVFWKDLGKVTASDFETQNIEIVSMSQKRWGYLNNEPVSSSNALLGAVAVWPVPTNGIGLSMHIAESINQLRATSALMKMRNVEANFGKNLVDIIQNGIQNPLQISRLPISWRTVFHHYGQRLVRDHTEFFGPHLLHEDIKAHVPLKVLAGVSPVFKWWQDLEYAAKKTEQGIVSLSLLDVINSQDKPYKQRSVGYFRDSLWHEFINRYLRHPSVEQHFMQQLEPQTVPVEDLRPNTEPEYNIRQMIEAGV